MPDKKKDKKRYQFEPIGGGLPFKRNKRGAQAVEIEHPPEPKKKKKKKKKGILSSALKEIQKFVLGGGD